ncbi:SLOG family protein [Alkalicoccus daliensis]|uniref:Uncharacterized SPBc2 prophage-derived protein YoqJ n=1 Tax=Alkalicoccus daliensis TaxID=745820 RepID=A0A1H0AFK1_9BACI|nr:SLOG family protein [Alkalicoccus daliensis]SDN32340.1 Uncharacterized SPBc2 prophage-derived protein YoqJ [Alkalicoccus daliensis]
MYTVIAVSGYKPHEIGVFKEKHEQLPYLKKAIKRKIHEIIEAYGTEWIVTSGQSGIELWAAEAAIELKAEGVAVKVATIAPFFAQEEKYSEPTKELYKHIWEASDFKDFITKRAYEGPEQLRMKNDFIIQKTDALLLVYDETTAGTPKFYEDAALKRQENTNYPILYMSPEDIEDLIREELDDWN